MPTNKIFTTKNVRIVDFGRNDKHGYASIKFPFSKAIAVALGWPTEIPDSTGEWCPEQQSVKASMVEFTPDSPLLKPRAFSLDAVSLGKFVVVRKKAKAGKNAVKASKRITSVTAEIVFSDPEGCIKLEPFYLSANEKSDMRVHYTPEAEQDDLPGTRVDMSPEEAQPFLPGGPTEEVRAAVEEMDTDEEETAEEMVSRIAAERAARQVEATEGPAPTHAEKLAMRKEESRKKRELRPAGPELVQ